MPFAAKQLAPGEALVLDLRPHWKVLIAPTAVLVAVVGVASYLLSWLPSGRYQTAGRVAVLVVGVALLAGYALVPYLRWRTTHFVLTDRRVLVRSGVLSRTGRDVPLTRVNDVTFSHGLLERMLGCGTLVVESAGERGQVVLPSVPHVESVQRRLSELVEAVDVRQ